MPEDYIWIVTVAPEDAPDQLTINEDGVNWRQVITLKFIRSDRQ